MFWTQYDERQRIKCNEGQEIRFIDPDEFGRLEFAKDNKKFFEEASQKALTTGTK